MNKVGHTIAVFAVVLPAIGRFEHEHRAIARHAAQLVFRKCDLLRVVHDVDQIEVFPIVEIVALSPLQQKDIASRHRKLISLEHVHRATVRHNHQLAKGVAMLNFGQIVRMGWRMLRIRANTPYGQRKA